VRVGDRTPAAPPTLSWPRAILFGLGITIALAFLLVSVPDLVLTRFIGLGRSTRVTIATAWFFVGLGLVAWTLRRLQARRII
jgi:hypothetical protein